MDAAPSNISQRFALSTPAVTSALMPVLGELTDLAEGIGASDFSLLAIDPGHGQRPVPLVDCAYPDSASLSQQMVEHMPASLIRHACASTIVAWWALPGLPNAARMERLRWAMQVAPIGTARAGIAMPLHAEPSRHGILVLTGPELHDGEEELWDAHSAALAIFGRLQTLREAHETKRGKLSRRELECLRLTAEGQTSEEIASLLGLSVHTANQYLANASQKLDAVNRMHAVAKALRLGLID